MNNKLGRIQYVFLLRMIAYFIRVRDRCSASSQLQARKKVRAACTPSVRAVVTQNLRDPGPHFTD